MDRADIVQWKARDVARLVAILETERRYYQEILAFLPMGVVMVSQGLAIVTANRKFRELAGLRLDDLQQKTLTEVVPSADLEAAANEALRQGRPQSALAVTLADRPFRATVVPIRFPHGEAEFDVLVALEEAAAVVRTGCTLLSDVPALVWSLNPETLHYDTVEGSADLLCGYSEQHWLSTPGFWLERVHADYRAAVGEFYRKAIEKGGEYSCEFRAVTAAQKTFWCRDAFRVVKDDNGQAQRICGFSMNVTAHRSAESDNVQANRVDALVGLARRLSHQLNNSLMIVTGYGEELLAGLPDHDPRKADVQAILAAAEAMAGTTGELAGFTRSQASPAAPLDILALLTGAGARIRQELGATLVLRLPAEPLSALGDATQLEAVLLSIARRLRDKLDPHMVIAANEISVNDLANGGMGLKPAQYIDIAIRGPYPAAVDPSAFETLLSGKDPHSTDLARAYAIVRTWGGTMFAGRTDQSSEVRILLPAVCNGKARNQPETRVAPQEPVQTADPVAPAPITVLVVEDEAGIRALVRKMLTREGYDVIEASTADDAMEAARRHEVDLLLTDLALRGKGGRELSDQLSAQYPNLRTLYISGYSDDPDLVSRNIGAAAAFLQKPFTLTALIRKVREVLGPPPAPSQVIARAAGAGALNKASSCAC